MTYFVHYGNLRTGQPIATLPASEASWSTELLASGSASIALSSGELARTAWANTPVGATFWAIEWADNGGRRIVAAGPVWSKSFDGASASLVGSGMFSVFSKRRLIPKVTTANMPKNDVTFSNLDLGSIIRGIANHLLTDTNGDLPIVLEASRAGTHTRTYLGYESAWSDQRIRELSEVENGPEFDFRPRLTANGLGVEWLLVTGTEAQPQLVGSTVYTLDATAPRQTVVGSVSGEFDASSMATTAWAIGGGTERAQVMRAGHDTALLSAGYPRLETDATYESVDGTRVQEYANGLIARTKRPARGVRVEVSAAYWYGLGANLGDRVRLIYDHPIIGRLDLTSRVIGESGSISSQWVTLTLADTLAEDLF